jgi:hypothetical protein
LTDEHLTSDGEQVLTLQQLIRARMTERSWTYAELERRSDFALTKGRWQQLGSGTRIAAFPEPATIAKIGEVLEVDVTTVVLAAAQSVGLDARRRGPDLAQLLPAGTDRLSERMRDAILTIIRAAVADSLAHAEDVDEPGSIDGLLEWPKSDAPSARRNAVRQRSDTDI